MNDQLKVGDVLEAVNPTALARRVLVTEVAGNYFKAAVLEGENTKDPITVFKAGWPLYAKTANEYLAKQQGMNLTKLILLTAIVPMNAE